MFVCYICWPEKKILYKSSLEANNFKEILSTSFTSSGLMQSVSTGIAFNDEIRNESKIRISSSVADEPQWSTGLLWWSLKFGHTCVYFLTVSVHRDSYLMPKGLRFLPICFFVSKIEASREPKRWRASEMSYICKESHQWWSCHQLLLSFNK